MTAPAAPPPAAPPVAPPVTPPAAPSASPPPAAPPEWLKDVPAEYHDSFKQYGSVADVLKAHNELRTKLSSKAPPADDLSIKPEAAPKVYEDASEILVEAGLDPAEVASQWERDGKLTDEQYKKLHAKGWSKKAVDREFANAAKLREYAVKEIRAESAKLVGGEQQLNALIQWGRQQGSLTDAERAWYASQIDNPASAVRAVEWLNGKYAAAVGAGRAAPLIEGGGAARPVAPFSSKAEIASARNDPKYASDPAYRENYSRRIDATDMAKLA